MRHRVFGRKLGRDKDHRKALFKNLVTSLVLHEQIKTTEAKAKAIKGLVDKVITKGRTGSFHARRVLASFFTNQKAVEKVMKVLVPRFQQRRSGFTRLVRLGRRRGDNAPLVRMELVDKEIKEKKPAKSKFAPGGKKKVEKEKRGEEEKEAKEKREKPRVITREVETKEKPAPKRGFRPTLSSLIKRPPKKTE